MKKLRVRLLSGLLSLSLCFGFVCSGMVVRADSQRIVTLGADLTEEQEDTVLKFFGVSDSDLSSMNVVTVTNQDEREVLSGIAPESAIGTKTYSCAYIEPTVSGGIKVRTANLTYVTVSSLYNALQTAGVENCNLVVTAPFEVSGTGALTGVFKAFESTGNKLDEEKQAVAAEELLLGSKIESEYGEDGIEAVSTLKDSVVSSGKSLTEEEIRKLIDEEFEKRGLNLSEEDAEALKSLLSKLKGLGYSVDAFSEKLNDLSEKLDDVEPEGIWESIVNFFRSIGDFFKNLFGFDTDEDDSEDVEEEDSDPSIFDDVDTDIFEFDEVEGTEDSEEGEGGVSGTDGVENDIPVVSEPEDIEGNVGEDTESDLTEDTEELGEDSEDGDYVEEEDEESGSDEEYEEDIEE